MKKDDYLQGLVIGVYMKKDDYLQGLVISV